LETEERGVEGVYKIDTGLRAQSRGRRAQSILQEKLASDLFGILPDYLYLYSVSLTDFLKL